MAGGVSFTDCTMSLVMITEKKDLEIAVRFKKQLLENQIPVVKTVVFGSRARGDADIESDLDIFVILDHSTPTIEKQIADISWEISFDTGIVIQTVVMTTERLQGPEKSSLLMIAIAQEGITV